VAGTVAGTVAGSPVGVGVDARAGPGAAVGVVAADSQWAAHTAHIGRLNRPAMASCSASPLLPFTAWAPQGTRHGKPGAGQVVKVKMRRETGSREHDVMCYTSHICLRHT